MESQRDPDSSISSGDNNAIEPMPSGKDRKGKIRLPRGGWLKSPFEDLKLWVSKQDKMNPKEFLKKFESIAKYEEIEDEKQLYFLGNV